MIISALFVGLLTALGFILLVNKVDRTVFLLFLGYGWATDAGITAVCVLLGASTGTAIGLFMSLFAGIILSLYLSAAKQFLGHARIFRATYVDNKGRARRHWFKFHIQTYPPEGMKKWAHYFRR